MTDQPDETQAVRDVWQYDGSWTKIPDPITADDAVQDYDALMSRAGFSKADAWAGPAKTLRSTSIGTKSGGLSTFHSTAAKSTPSTYRTCPA